MKSKIILLAAILITTIAFSQTKVGTVNSDLIIGKMPQMKTVLKRVENAGKKLDSSFNVKTKNYQTKAQAFQDAQKTLSDADKSTKYQELVTLEQEIQKFRVNGTKMMQLQRDEYMRPLYKKLSEVITEVAKANGYTQILTTGGNEFGYIDERFDITKLVLTKLGIKE
ncbi:OmpH family outer membrane protein [Tenacibaculum insulae]|uniref:OmpH family outer membrane protein n=1 Tax=Tenacibaculum insulae TaxID=2029677 RepID=UPI003AB646C8